MAELTKRQAEELLIEYAAVTASRDDRVRTAHLSGITKSEISRLTGIARTTIDRIIETDTGSEPDGPESAQNGRAEQ